MITVIANSRIEWGAIEWRTGLPLPVMALLMALALAYTVWMYRREKLVAPWQRAGMAALRVVALLLLIMLLFRPVLSVSEVHEVPGQAFVLLDDSPSMEIKDVRKARDSLLDAALATGRMPFVRPRAQADLAEARLRMREAAELMRAQKLNEALNAQGSAFEALVRAVTALHAEGETAVPAELVARVEGLRDEQEELANRVAGAGPQGEELSREQAALADRLDALLADLRDPGSPITNEMQSELARVSRREIAGQLLNHEQFNVFEALSERLKLRYYGFADEATPTGRETWPGEGEPGDATHIGDALRTVLSEAGRQSVAGALMLTDGGNTGGEDPLAVAEECRRRAIPLYPVPVGLAEPDDVAMRSVIMQDLVFVGDRVRVRVQMDSRGYENRTTTLSVMLDDAQVASQPVLIEGRPQIEEITFEVDEVTGRRDLAVELSPLPNEALLENNRVSRTIRVKDEKLKVLCIEGSPRWEYRYLRAVLKRDPRVDVRFMTTEGDRELARASREHVGRFPEDPEEAFSYDLVILGDVRSDTFTPDQFELMHQLIRDRGGALIVLAGHKHNPTEYLNTPVGQMLPVEPRQEDWPLVDDNAYPVLTPEGEEGTVMQLLEGESRNRQLWTKVKPLVRVPPLEGARRGARVLAELSTVVTGAEPTPLIAWHRYGNGKVLFIGTDRLFRLRDGVGDKFHARFWGQAIQFMALSRLRGDDRRINFEVSGAAGPGEPVSIYASALDEIWEPMSAPQLTARVRKAEDGRWQPVALNPVPSIEGMYHGFYVPPEPGGYEVTASEALAGAANLVSFEVSSAGLEQSRVAVDSALLRKLAQLSGGRYLEVRQLPELLQALDVPPERTEVRRQIEVFDNWLWLIPLVGLLAAEWYWRRRKDLA